MTIVPSTLNALQLYGLSAYTRDYELDGRASIAVAHLLTHKAEIIAETFGASLSTTAQISLIVISVGLGCVATAWKNNPTKNDGVYRVIHCAGEGLYHAIQHGDKLINSALAVYYVAQLTLYGFQAGAFIGLAGLVLIGLKQSGCLPAHIDEAFLFLFPYVEIFNTIHSDFIWPIKLCTVFMSICMISSHPYVRWGTRPDYIATHEFKPLDSIPTSTDGSKINRSYIYSECLNRLLPPLEQTSTTKERADKLAAAIEAKMPELKEDSGWQALTNGVCNDRFEGTIPYSLDLFRLLMIGSMEASLEADDWETKLRELADIGKHCTSGWTRDLGFIYNPRSKSDLAWSVHLALAKWRSAVLVEEVTTTFRDTFAATMAGGENDIHLVGGMHLAARHRIRTYDGEVAHQLAYPSYLECLLWHQLLRDNRQSKNLFGEWIRIITLFEENTTLYGAIFGGEMLKFFGAIQMAEMGIFQSDSKEKHIDCIYEAIKPSYTVDKNHKAEYVRTIPWEAVIAWMRAFAERLDLDGGEIYATYVETDLLEQPLLTRQGVQLLLLDLGILEQ